MAKYRVPKRWREISSLYISLSAFQKVLYSKDEVTIHPCAFGFILSETLLLQFKIKHLGRRLQL
jgi:hypothetical protein